MHGNASSSDQDRSRQESVVAVTVAAGGWLKDFCAMAEVQAACQECQDLFSGHSPLQFQEFNMGQNKLLCDVSTGAVRKLVPLDFQWQVFESMRGILHPGTRATKRLISACFVWPHMATDIASWGKECVGCACSKVVRNMHTPLQPIPIPAKRFCHMYVDLVGPLPISKEGYTHLCTMVDRSTR